MMIKEDLLKDIMACREGLIYFAKNMCRSEYKSDDSDRIAEDCVQESLIKAINKWEQFDEERGKLSTWLYQITRNEILLYIRKNSKHNRLIRIDAYIDNTKLIDNTVDVNDMLEEQSEQYNTYKMAINYIKSNESLIKKGLVEVFISYYNGTLDTNLDDIAEEFGLHNATLRTIFHRVKLSIREKIIKEKKRTAK